MTLVYFEEVPKDISDLGGKTDVEDKEEEGRRKKEEEEEDMGDVNLKNIDNNSFAKKGTKDISDTERCSISGEENSKFDRIQTKFDYKGDKNSDEKSQASSSNWCFMMSTSLVVITIICFILSGSILAVRTKTNTDIISLKGRLHLNIDMVFKSPLTWLTQVTPSRW